jgi:hypothetical protein
VDVVVLWFVSAFIASGRKLSWRMETPAFSAMDEFLANRSLAFSGQYAAATLYIYTLLDQHL